MGLRQIVGNSASASKWYYTHDLCTYMTILDYIDYRFCTFQCGVMTAIPFWNSAKTPKTARQWSATMVTPPVVPLWLLDPRYEVKINTPVTGSGISAFLASKPEKKNTCIIYNTCIEHFPCMAFNNSHTTSPSHCVGLRLGNYEKWLVHVSFKLPVSDTNKNGA